MRDEPEGQGQEEGLPPCDAAGPRPGLGVAPLSGAEAVRLGANGAQRCRVAWGRRPALRRCVSCGAAVAASLTLKPWSVISTVSTFLAPLGSPKRMVRW